MAELADVKTVIVRSPSVLRETGFVARAVFHIVLWTATLMGATWGGSNATATATRAKVAVDEVAFGALDSADQRMYRQMLEGLGEAEDVRSRTADWPTVEQLAVRRIPPFAPDPVDRAGYRWRTLRDGPLVNYIGTPDAASKRPTFVIVVVEPERGIAPDPGAITDETHHKLKDGTLLHVSLWTGSRALSTPASTPAFEDGWRRITMATP